MGECAHRIERLVLAAKAGRTEAFEALAARFRPTMLLIARSVCDDFEIAQDAVQDALLTAFHALGSLDSPSRFGPWLATIVRNRARRLAQDGYRLRSRPLSDAPAFEDALSEGVEDAVRALPEGVRESTLLYYFGGWSVGEVANLLERPTTTVKWQLHAGRTLLRKRLTHFENTP